MPSSPKAGSEITRASSTISLPRAINILDLSALSAIPVQQQQRCAFGGLEQGVVRGVEAVGQLIGKTDAQGTQLLDTCRHVWIAEHEHGAVQRARAVIGYVEVIGGQRQVRIGCVQLLGRDEPQGLPE